MNRSGSGCTKCIPCDLFPFGSCVRLAGGSARPLSLQGENYDPGLQAAAPKRPSPPPPLRQKKHTPQTPAIPRVGVLRLRLPQLPALSLGSLGMSEASSASRSIRHRTSRPRGEMVSWLAESRSPVNSYGILPSSSTSTFALVLGDRKRTTASPLVLATTGYANHSFPVTYWCALLSLFEIRVRG